MSTYAVFGMTRPRAVAMARERVRFRDDMSEAQWWAAVQADADRLMAGTHCVQLSERYDAPQFAFEYLRLAKRTTECRSLHVQSYAKTGATHPKTGKPVCQWALVESKYETEQVR